jgi:CRISPR-associated protein Cas6
MPSFSVIDLHFPVRGSPLPTDHAYVLYAALTTAAPALHATEVRWRVAGIPGHTAANGLLQLEPRRSRLRFRLPPEHIQLLLPLAGRTLDVAGHAIRLGLPQVRPLAPAAALVARVVTIKGFIQPGPFLAAVRRQLDALGVAGEAAVPLTMKGTRQGQPHRHILRIKDKQVVGYAVRVIGLSADESLTLQEHGVGGRGHLGCGFFVPLKPRAS